MAEKRTEDNAEQAYAEAAAKLKPAAPAKAPAKKAAAPNKPVPAALDPAPKPAPVLAKAVETPKPQAPKPAAKKPLAVKRVPVPKAAPAAKPAPAVVPVARISVPAAPPVVQAEPVPVAAPVIAEIVPPTVTEPKELIMATTATQTEALKTFTDTASDTMTDAMNELQGRAQVAYEKSTEALGEISDFAKGNVEAIVESSKIVAGGVQGLGKTYVEEAKSAYETLTADLKEMAAVKSPTELFQLQGKIMRRNFDALVAAGSKNTEAAIKLANDAFAPLSGRMNVAADKLAKVA